MQRWLMSVVWPGFLLACSLEVLVFALIDPAELHWGGESWPIDRPTLYSLTFFVFWALGIGSCALTFLVAEQSGSAAPLPFEDRTS